MFRRNNKQKELAAVVASLGARIAPPERCVLVLCDKIEALQRPRVVRVLDKNYAPSDVGEHGRRH
jgi:hypothetical protein